MHIYNVDLSINTLFFNNLEGQKSQIIIMDINKISTELVNNENILQMNI